MVDVEGKFVLASGKWPFLTENYLLMLDLGTEKIENLIIFAGHDWRMRRKPFSLPDSIVGDVLSGEKE